MTNPSLSPCSFQEGLMIKGACEAKLASLTLTLYLKATAVLVNWERLTVYSPFLSSDISWTKA